MHNMQENHVWFGTCVFVQSETSIKCVAILWNMLINFITINVKQPPPFWNKFFYVGIFVNTSFLYADLAKSSLL